MGYNPQEFLRNTSIQYHGYTVRGTPNCPLNQDLPRPKVADETTEPPAGPAPTPARSRGKRGFAQFLGRWWRGGVHVLLVWQGSLNSTHPFWGGSKHFKRYVNELVMWWTRHEVWHSFFKGKKQDSKKSKYLQYLDIYLDFVDSPKTKVNWYFWVLKIQHSSVLSYRWNLINR